MWASTVNITNTVRHLAVPLLGTSTSVLSQQTRNTYILQRKWPPGLHKKNGKPKPLRGRHYVYEVLEDTTKRRRPDMDVILTSYVESMGNKGDRVTMRPNAAYAKLLLPGLAVYATPENMAKYVNLESQAEAITFSSPYVERTMNYLSHRTLAIRLSDSNPWTLEKWHVKSSFRKCGFHMECDAITLPEKTISGPDPELEGKEFYVTVTINKQEQIKVRCRIYHLDNTYMGQPLDPDFYKTPAEPLFPEDKPILDAMPRHFDLKKSKAL